MVFDLFVLPWLVARRSFRVQTSGQYPAGPDGDFTQELLLVESVFGFLSVCQTMSLLVYACLLVLGMSPLWGDCRVLMFVVMRLASTETLEEQIIQNGDQVKSSRLRSSRITLEVGALGTWRLLGARAGPFCFQPPSPDTRLT